MCPPWPESRQVGQDTQSEQGSGNRVMCPFGRPLGLGELVGH